MKKILIIKESKAELEIISALLSLEGFAVYEADNLTEGMQIIEDIFPNLIIYDINKSIVEAFYFLNFLTTNFVTSKIPFIILSSNIHSRKLNQFNIKNIFLKPVIPKELIMNVKNILNSHKQQKSKIGYTI